VSISDRYDCRDRFQTCLYVYSDHVPAIKKNFIASKTPMIESVMKNIYMIFLVISSLSVTGCNSPGSEKKTVSFSDGGYYIDGIHGSDKNPGTVKKPIKTISELNLRLKDKAANINFAGGQVFDGLLILENIIDPSGKPIKIKSYGNGRAVINGGNTEALKIENCRNIWVLDLNLKGSGRKKGNVTNGLSMIRSSFCRAENIAVSGFQKSGIDLYNCTETRVRKVIAIDNGFCGINIMGSARNLSKKIFIVDCKAENNPGDPSNLSNHSGNGILVGVSDSVTIDHCSATNNGWDMPRQGNGPVGIWAWESDHVTIQYCISYRNKTSEKAKDGGGFDLDGGVTNSVIQYCLSYENQGAGYGLFQYAGASYWSGNIVRYCVSINDALTTEGAGSIFIWNGSDKIDQLTNCMIYNNVIYNSGAPLISYENSSKHRDFIFCNNIFLGSDQPILGNYSGSAFLGNDWWSNDGTRKFMNFNNLRTWAQKTGQEMIKGQYVGIQEDPKLIGPLVTEITDPYQLESLTGYCLLQDSPLKNKGLDILSVFHLKQPDTDFFGNPVPLGRSSEPGIYEMK
jgi:hypothetical protein